ncbi:nickel transporter permease [Cytobacillus firmus]|uniref:Permease protein DppC n=1 Tax=Cytobacillus firmus TaxID=1399 RepID=A0A380Y565_CYTFI|nr:nickel transporter permease [Cytobacillus firmus]KAF0825120.1 permease protein DppC [Cytobacillus firmus]MDD9310262.1 ABC transporter permease [Cytobacillus firmus]MEC1893937.1 ABC transporter permease [Cytobacillus firmus]MED1939003.1 ABC transporter permease [Cytobacillus firmus]MED4449570.1 ABC transporter permease [Cytobacillus firmus]
MSTIANPQETAKAPVPVSKRKAKGADLAKALIRNKMSLVGGSIVFIYIILAVLAPLISPYDPYEIDLVNKLQPPSSDHIMGTDDKGRDIFSRILYGSQLSLAVGFVSVFIGALFGIVLGIVSGYYGGWVDTIIMRFIDVLLAFPGLLLALAIVSALGPSLINVMIAVGVFSIPTFARIVRGSTLSVKKMEYIDAIRVLGASDLKIIFVHILPNIMSPIIVQGTLRLATSILSVAGLSFLGMGAQPPTPEWGAMLSDGRDFLFTAPHIALFPGIAIALIVLGFNLFGDGLRDALDPRMKN